MKKILFLVGSMNIGGAETLLMKFIRKFKSSEFEIEIGLFNFIKNDYEDELIELGIKIHKLNPKKRFFRYFFDLYNLNKIYKFHSIIRITQNFTSIIDLFIMNISYSSKLYIRASNTRVEGGLFYHFFHLLFRSLFVHNLDGMIAPNSESGKFMFGKKMINSPKYVTLFNGVDLNTFQFSLQHRKNLQAQYNIYNSLIIGNISRFEKQKNHEFFIKLVLNLLDRNFHNFKILLIGDGSLKTSFTDKLVKLNIHNYFIILEKSTNIYQYYSLIDIFLMPSFYEGLPNVIIEAQACDLDCMLSDRITSEVKFTENVNFFPLSQISLWSDFIITYKIRDRINHKRVFYKFSFDETYNKLFNLITSDKKYE